MNFGRESVGADVMADALSGGKAHIAYYETGSGNRDAGFLHGVNGISVAGPGVSGLNFNSAPTVTG